MNVLKRFLLAGGCLFAAIACYVFGIPFGGLVFLLLGLVLEGFFWLNLFGRKKRSRTAP